MGRLKYQVQPASREELINVIKAANIPYPEKVFNLLRCEAIILDKERGQYTFREKPIHIDTLTKIVEDARNQTYEYQNRHKQLNKVEHVLNEESAIAFLKQKGYKILKKTYTEI